MLDLSALDNVDDKIAASASAEYVAYAPTTYRESFKVSLTLNNVSANAKTSVGDYVTYSCKDAEGNVLAQRSNSIREYAMLYLDLSTATALDSALMVAMLEFGSLAQIGLGQTDVLANYLLNDTYRANLTQYAWPN